MPSIQLGDVFGWPGRPGATRLFRYVLRRQIDGNILYLARNEKERAQFANPEYWERLLAQHTAADDDEEATALPGSLEAMLERVEQDSSAMEDWREMNDIDREETEAAAMALIEMLRLLDEERYPEVVDRLVKRAKELRRHLALMDGMEGLPRKKPHAELAGNADFCELMARMIAIEHRIPVPAT